MNKKRKIGDYGEIFAQRYFVKNGFEILNTNFVTKFGEIDIICQNNEYILFVEVKLRDKNSIALGREAVGKQKINRIINSALIFFQNFATNKQPRFDVIEIVADYSKRKYRLNHIKNAFGMEGHSEIF